MLGPNEQEVANVIEKGHIPLFYYNSQTKSIKVKQNVDWKERFIVFSHAWEDGYGNTQANEAHKCVVELWHRLCGKAYSIEPSLPPTMPKYFWIDTFGIPVQFKYNSQRLRSMGSIHEIYRRAMATVILDSGLESHRLKEYPMAAMHITTCHWMSRIWTLQEGYLSENLLFVFEGKNLHSLNDITREVRTRDDQFHKTISEVVQSYEHLLLIRERRRHLPPLGALSAPPIATPEFVASLMMAVPHHRASHPQDEALAIAILLNLNTNHFPIITPSAIGREPTDEELQLRMKKLLEELANTRPKPDKCVIPRGAIFLRGEKLSIEGFRWARRTWLSEPDIFTPNPLHFNEQGSLF